MPRLSVWMIRAALLYLGLGFTFGALILFNKGLPYDPLVWRWLPVHIEFLLIGWMVQLALGVAFWILPRHTQGPKRGNERWFWLAAGLFNLGVLAIAGGYGFGLEGGFLLGGRVLELASALLFALNLWPRIKPFAA